MPSWEILLAFLAATSVFAYMPGPAMLYTTAQTLARGRRAGLMAALGIHIGGYAHVLAAATGLSLLFQAVPVLYTVIKLLGAIYLIWLGVGLLRQAGGPVSDLPAVGPRSAHRALWQSVSVEVLNPKTAIFFLAFLPQFTDPGAGWPLWVQLIVLGIVVNGMFSSADILCVAMAGAMRSALARSRRAQQVAKALGGSLLIGLGLHLAAQPRG